jgi:amino acid adenylation domain-containing protein
MRPNSPVGLALRVLDQARRTPAAVAVVDADRTLDYAGLDSASAAVADALRSNGVRPGEAVAVCLPRSWRLVCAMLGILRLGATVVPLDAQSPPVRRAHILADSGAVAVIKADAEAGALPELAVDCLLSGDCEPSPTAVPAAVSFVFYTSGTTGRPKGVEVRDAGILRLAQSGYIRLADATRFACMANPAFDAVSFEVWVPLLTGGCCVILSDEEVRTPHLLSAALVRERVDTVFVTVALFNAVVDRAPHCFAETGQVLVGGEQLNAPLIRRWYQDNPASGTRLYNIYGPTEATTFALCHPIPRDFDADVVPIGRALPGTATAVLVDGTRPAEPGEVAELYLGGEALAVGYRNLPEETASRFVRLPPDDSRYYRTGDLVRSRPDGSIVYLGRADRQVKVRGFRVEPEEVERQIAAHPAVRQAFVCTRRAPEHELLAYLMLDADVSFEAVEEHLAATLPPYMRPHRIYLVDALPRNANGKIDQAVLVGGDHSPWRGRSAAGPVTGWQREVLDLAGEVLGVPDLGPGDRWAANGGDSLKALRLRFEVRRRWDCELPQSLVLQSDFARLAEAIESGRAESPYPGPVVVSGARSAPATSEQQRLWLLQQRQPQSCAYNVGLAFHVTGPADTVALREALRRSVERHPALRTAFEATADGLRQVVAEPYDPWTHHGTPDWQDFFATPFDLAEPQLMRASWLPQDDGGLLLLRLHHIAVDGWSLNLLFQDLSADLRGARDKGPVPTPLDFAVWQADWFASPGYLAQRDELRAFYAGLDEVSAPLEPIGSGTGAGLVQTTLDDTRRAALDRLGAELGLTRFQVLLSVFAWSLYGVTGRAHPHIASPVANRPVQDFESSIGMFANTVLLPLDLMPRDDLRTQLRRQAAGTHEVLGRQEVAFADVPLESRVDRRPFDFLFVLENTDFTVLSVPGCVVRPMWPAPVDVKCPLTLSVVERETGFDCLWEYSGEHFDAAEVEAVASLFEQALDWVTDGRDATLAELVAPYRRALPDPGRGVVSPLTFATVAEGFAEQVRRTPDAPALVSGGRRLSYADLDAHAAALAAELQAGYSLPQDDSPCSVVLHFGPSVEHVVSLLALARLNVTIVPLDPAYPPALLNQILSQVDPLCVLLPPDGETAVDLKGIPSHPVILSTATSGAPRHVGRPLYTLFTSGSTGRPKGVQVPDTTLCNLLQWQSTDGGLAPGAVTQQFSMLSFDVSFQEIFGTLCGGGCLHLARPQWRQDAPALLEYLELAGVERIFMPYVALQLLAEHAVHLGLYPSRLREVVSAGEQLVCTDAIRRWFTGLRDAHLFNHYGPTETHVVSGLRLDGDPADWTDRPAIGSPVANAWLRVVDDVDETVPPGCPGTLLIGGPMAVPCYLGDDVLNEQRFVDLPGLGRFYRSGDLARFDRQGLLHYLGRDDQQVKLSGHRLELGQVEAALLRHPAVVNAVVVPDGGELVACLQCRGASPASQDLVDHLAALLPAYVRIDRFRRVAALPRTPGGKLDRQRALAEPGEELSAAPAATARSLSPREAQLTGVFESVIGRSVGPDQTFFEAGATSLGLMRFHLRCTADLGLPLSIPDLFEHVTIRRLAGFVDGQAAPARAMTAGLDEPIAIIGMAVRLPGADDLAAFWDMVRTGGRGIEHFAAEDGLVGARSQMSGLLAFDPAHFGISPQEARLMDPQQRHMLMSCVEALAHAGIADPAARRVGLVASCGENTYFQAMLREADPARLPDSFQLALHHDKDFLATKAAYHLGLTGPAFTVQAACASSLVAVHVAAGMLRHGDADVMLAGGVLVDTLLTGGYRYRPEHILSEDGHCRPFSDDSSGTVGGSGAGVVVLKPLSQARRDGDTVYAVISGSALNNDGSGKLGYSAPSLPGQREVIRAALRRSGRDSADLGYVEAHGTGTRLGDPVEVAALRQAYDLPESGRCALASVKSQIGHLGAAAGVAGLVRAALAVHHGVIPPNVDFRRLNPRIDPDPFVIPTEATPWPVARPRAAAVSSFGIGGTNAHIIIEAAEPDALPSGVPCLMLSSSSAAGLRADAARIADYLTARPETYSQVLRHLQAGRPPRRWRIAAACPGAATAVAWLRNASAVEVTPIDEVVEDQSPETLAEAWLTGRSIGWPAGPAQAPWDFPPPSFDLVDFDFPRASAPAAERLPEAEWLHQPHWVRHRRASAGASSRTPGVLILMTAEPLPQEALTPWETVRAQVIQVIAGRSFTQLTDDTYEVDPADPVSLRQLLDALPGVSIDWVHALPLSVGGPVGRDALARATWACLDTTAALLQAGSGRQMKVWWLSHQAQPVEGVVQRPDLGLLAGPCEVVPQESSVEGHWLDLPSPDLAEGASVLPDLMADPGIVPRRLALRQGYWWEQAVVPVASPGTTMSIVDGGVYLVLGGTGGIGRSIAAWLLAQADCRVVLLARHAHVPATLAPWANRVDVITADLSVDAGLPDLPRIDGIVHAAGVAAGGLIARRDAAAMRQAMAAKHQGALLTERLIERYRPDFAVYCSSMSAQFGGAGHFDYAAANGLLDGFARHQAGTTLRVVLDWDIWSDAGMAVDALPADARHQAHLAVGLSTAEGQRLFARALCLQLPHLLVSTTPFGRAREFYSAATDLETPAVTSGSAVAQLTDSLRQWLGVDHLDPAQSLYDLGADSLTLLDLIGEVKRHFGVDISLSQLSQDASLAEVLALLGEGPAADTVALEIWQEGRGRELLCLVHPVGGDIQAYRALVSALDPRLTVCLIADPALHRPDLPLWTLADRAHRYYAALQSRFPHGDWQWRLGGWSFGAWVALGMAAEAEATGRPADAVYLVDPPPPDSGPEFQAYDEQQLEAVFAQELGQTVAPQAKAYTERLARCARANIASMAQYALPRLTGTPGWLWLAGRAAEPDTREQRWRVHLPGLVTSHAFDTTHYGIVRTPHVRAIAETINVTTDAQRG